MIWLFLFAFLVFVVALGWLVGSALARHERTRYVSEATARKYRRSARQS